MDEKERQRNARKINTGREQKKQKKKNFCERTLPIHKTEEEDEGRNEESVLIVLSTTNYTRCSFHSLLLKNKNKRDELLL